MRCLSMFLVAAALSAPAFTRAQSASVPLPPASKLNWGWSGAMPATGMSESLQYFQCEGESAAVGVQSIVFYFNPYSGDSSVCSAAIHAGVIRRDQGGVFAARLVGSGDKLPAGYTPGATIPARAGAGGLTSSPYTYSPTQKLFWIFPATLPLVVDYRGTLKSVEIVVDGKVLGIAAPGRPLTIQAPPEGLLEVAARSEGRDETETCVLGQKKACVVTGPSPLPSGAASGGEGSDSSDP